MDRDALPDLVLVHGWASGPFAWGAVIDALATRFNITTASLPGYGAEYEQFPRRVETLANWLKQRTPADATWLVWSAGALAGLYLAAGPRAHIARLNIVSGVVRFTAASDWPHGSAPGTLDAFHAAFRTDPDALIRRFARLLLYPANDRDAVEKYVTALGDGGVALSGLEAGLDLLAASDLRGCLSRIEVPCAWFHGDLDRVVAPGSSAAAAQAVRDGRYTPLHGTGHAPFLTHPELFLRKFYEEGCY